MPATGATLRAKRQTVLAMVRCAEQHTAVVINPDRLAAADRLLREAGVMSAPNQFVPNGRRDRRLQRQHTVERKRARRFSGGLDVHLHIEYIGEQVGMAGGLVMSAHDTE